MGKELLLKIIIVYTITHISVSDYGRLTVYTGTTFCLGYYITSAGLLYTHITPTHVWNRLYCSSLGICVVVYLRQRINASLRKGAPYQVLTGTCLGRKKVL